MTVTSACVPRDEVLKGELEDAIFAASLDALVNGRAPGVYSDARVFFENTHPATRLRETADRVFRHLRDPREGGVFVRLSTGYGGGKTHALMALWHLAKNSGNPEIGTEVVPAANRPPNVAVAAIDLSEAGLPNFATHIEADGSTVVTHSLWGELAYQLKGKAGVLSLGEAEAADRQPNQSELAALLPDGPVLILLDESVVYFAQLREAERKAFLAFLQKLTTLATNRPQTAFVMSDPASQAVYADETKQLALATAADQIDQITGRKATDIDPIDQESSQVIVRRLFKKIDPSEAAAVAEAYVTRYQALVKDPAGKLVPDIAAREAYAGEILLNYPFHPRLMQTTRDRLSTISEYQRSRGTLRLFARIIRNVWSKQPDIDIITAGDVDWSDPDLRSDLLNRLNREGFQGAVNTDVLQHARELDRSSGRGIHERVASALLLESLTLESKAGLDRQDLTLAVLRASEAGTEPWEAAERLASVCWYTYPLESGAGYQFRIEPNVNQMIAQRAPTIPELDARERVHAEVQSYFTGAAFKLVVWPTNAGQVPDTAKLQLVLCDSVELARRVVSLKSEDNPEIEDVRQFRNAIVAVAPAHEPYQEAIALARRLKAAEAINAEHSDDAGKTVRNQLAPIITSLRRSLTIQSRRAFANVVLADKQVRPMEEKYLVPVDGGVAAPGNIGQANLKSFLEDKGLIFGDADALDVDLFVDAVLPGATPSTEHAGAYTGKAVHERMLGRQGLRLIPGENVTRRSILRAVQEGRLVLRLEDGTAFDEKGAVVGPPGHRERRYGEQPMGAFPLDDATLVAPAGSPIAMDWLAESNGSVEKEPNGHIPPPPPTPEGTRTSQWSEAAEWSDAGRLLRRLTFTVQTPTAAAALSRLAVGFGAQKLLVTVTCHGKARNDGGEYKFQVVDAPPSAPTHPLNMAATIYNVLEEAGRSFMARLTLDFGPDGRLVPGSAFTQAFEGAPEGITMTAEFLPQYTQGSLIQ